MAQVRKRLGPFSFGTQGEAGWQTSRSLAHQKQANTESSRSARIMIDRPSAVEFQSWMLISAAGRPDQKRKLAAVFIATAEGKSVSGFYTLSAESILAADLPVEFGKRMPRFPLPVTLLGRMAVAQSLHGQGLESFFFWTH